MKSGGGISRQLRARREALGLSLAEVARRAGTSAATLSRYEHGWDRFETYTLKKLATALHCELSIRLKPKPAARRTRSRKDRQAEMGKLKRLFWDHRLKESDFRTHPAWVTARVLDFGNLNDVRILMGIMGRRAFLTAAAVVVHKVSPRTGTFWRRILEMEGIPCTKAYSQSIVWTC